MSEPWEDFTQTGTAIDSAPWEDFAAPPEPTKTPGFLGPAWPTDEGQPQTEPHQYEPETPQAPIPEEVARWFSPPKPPPELPPGLSIKPLAPPSPTVEPQIPPDWAKVATAKEIISEPLIQAPTAPTVQETPVRDWERKLLYTAPGLKALSALVGEDVAVQTMREVYNQAKSVPEFFTSPMGVGTLMTGGLGRIPATAVTGYFTWDTLKGLVNHVEETVANWGQMTAPERARALVQAGGLIGLGAMLTHGTARGVAGSLQTAERAGKDAKIEPTTLGLARLKENLSNIFGAPAGLPRRELPPIAPPAIPHAPPAQQQPEKGPEYAIQERGAETLPVDARTEGGEALGEGVREPEKPAIPQEAEKGQVPEGEPGRVLLEPFKSQGQNMELLLKDGTVVKGSKLSATDYLEGPTRNLIDASVVVGVRPIGETKWYQPEPTPQPKVSQIQPPAAEPSQPTPGLPATPGEKAIPQEPMGKISPTVEAKQIAAKPAFQGGDVSVKQSAQAVAGGPTPTVPPTAATAKRIVRGLRARKVFDRETDLNGPDVLSFIVEHGGMMSKTSAQKMMGREWYDRNKAEWDGAPPMAKPHHNVIYNPETRETPDRLATAAYEAGVIREPDVNALWDAVERASKARSHAFEQERSQAKLIEAEAKEHEAWLKATKEGEQKIAAEELKIGDLMEVEGERVEVISIDPDSGEVTLKDGRKFGTQTLREGQKIYVENFQEVPEAETAFLEPEAPKAQAAPPGQLFPEKEMPFNLAGEKIQYVEPKREVTQHGVETLAQDELFAIQKVVQEIDPAKSADAAQQMYGGPREAIARLENQLRVLDADPKTKKLFVKEQRDRLRDVLSLLRQRAAKLPPGPGAKTAGEPPYAAAQLLTDQLKATQATTTKDTYSARERLADAWAEGKTLFERAFGNTRATAESLKDVARGVRDINDLDRRVGELDWLLQKSAGQSRNMGKAIQMQQPSKVTREAVALWIDAGGDVAKLRETLANLPAGTHPSVRRALERAVDLPPEGVQFAQQLEQFYGIRLNDARESEIFEHALDDYYTHIWQREANMPEKLRTAYSNGRVSDYFQFARQRKLPTFLDGILQGKRPVLDPAKVLPYYNYALDRAIASRKFVKELSEVNAPDGRPAVLPTGTARKVEGEEGGMFINPKGKTELGKDYHVIDHPAMRKWKWIGADENGNPVMYRSDLAANPGVHERLARMLDQRLATASSWGRRLLRASTEVKGMKLGLLSAFHQVHVGSHALFHWTSPFKIGEIDWESPATRFAVEKGHLKIAGDEAQIAQFSEGLLSPGLVHKIPILGPWSRAYSEYLFTDWIPKLKLKTFENAYDRNIKARDSLPGSVTGLKGLTDEQVAARVGDSINNAFGELNHWFLNKYGRSPQFQRILRGIFLAPDFGEARLRFVGKALTKAGMEERIAFATMITTMYAGARIANWLSHGDPELDPKNAFRVKVKLPGREAMEWVSMRSVAGDLVHALTNFGQFMYVRLNPLYSRTVSDVLFQRDVYGRKLSMGDIVVKRPLEQLVPINFASLTREDQDLWESGISSMGLQMRHDVPALDIGKLKREWLLKNPDPKLKAMGERADAEIFPPSDYGPLRRALFNNELGDAREAYEKLKTEKGKKPKDIAEAMRPYSGGKVDASGTYQPAKLKPIGGALSVADERKFYSTLTKSEKQLYAQAVAERKRIWQRFQEMMAKQ